MASLADILADLGCLSTGAGYPCGENPINIVSLSLAASGLALIMVSCGIYVAIACFHMTYLTCHIDL